MIDGVIKIAEHCVKEYSILQFIVANIFLLIGICFIIFIIYLIFTSIKDKFFDSVFIVPLFIMCLAGFICAGVGIDGCLSYLRHDEHIEYTVIIGDNCKYKEFVEKYEIISEEDGVYRIKEK